MPNGDILVNQSRTQSNQAVDVEKRQIKRVNDYYLQRDGMNEMLQWLNEVTTSLQGFYDSAQQAQTAHSGWWQRREGPATPTMEVLQAAA